MSNTLTFANYEIRSQISEEESTEVWAAVNVTDGSQVAIKFPKHGCTQTTTEANVITQIHHNVILPVIDILQSEFGLALVYPFCHGGDLFNLVATTGRLTEYQAFIITFPILAALCYCHCHGTWHRDVKPENILLMSNEITLESVRLTDFGYGILVGGNVLDGQWPGSSAYAAPEMRRHEPYTNKIDIYSCGRTLYFMVAGEMPTDDMDLNCLSWRFGVSDECINLLEAMLDPNAETRITVDDALCHSWFKRLSVENFKEEGEAINEEEGVM
jgi:serine/threonine protein kinase